MAHRIERFSSTLKQCLADIMANDIADPQLRMIFITDLIMSEDLKRAKVFVSGFDGNIEQAVQNLTRAKGFIKRVLAKKMYVKYVPDLTFHKDETMKKDRDQHQQIHTEEQNEEADR